MIENGKLIKREIFSGIRTGLLILCLAGILSPAFAQDLMPLPATHISKPGKFRLTPKFRAFVDEEENSRVPAALRRMLFRLDGRTGLNFSKSIDRVTGRQTGFLRVSAAESPVLDLGLDESYILEISPQGILIEAPTDLGAMHAMETLLQLLSSDASGFYFPCGRIEDAPKYPWRGLLIDVCRHWQPMEVLKRNIDGMAAVKMNVLHLHLTEDQGFRIESKNFPQLHLSGSNGDFFTQQQMRDLIRYADARGIRVVPEFDIPGHATAWFVGHPEMASAPGPYEIEKRFGVMDPAMDPTQETTYEILEIFFREMALLFPDPYFHIGGDENNGKHWDANPAIQQWMKERKIKDNHGLQAYFNQRVAALLESNDKIMVGWDEILQPELPNNIVIQSWRGKEALVEAAKKGYKVMLSNGFYIDLCKPASAHYLNEIIPPDAGLDEAERKNVIGGEATMWAELVTPETIDSRIWPRTAAISERLWSDPQKTDVEGMYERLDRISIQLEELGLRHLTYQPMMLRRLTNGQPIEALKTIVDAVEPLKVYARHHQGVKYSTELPFTRLPDAAFVESPARRQLEKLQIQLDAPDRPTWSALNQLFLQWSLAAQELEKQAINAPMLREILPLAQALSQAGEIGMEIAQYLEFNKTATGDWKAEQAKKLQALKKPVVECELAVIDILDLMLQRIPQK